MLSSIGLNAMLTVRTESISCMKPGQSVENVNNDDVNFIQHGLKLDVAIPDPSARSTLVPQALSTSPSMSQALFSRRPSCGNTSVTGGKSCLICNVVPLAFSTCGEHSVAMHRIQKGLARRGPLNYRVTITTAEQAGLIARKT